MGIVPNTVCVEVQHRHMRRVCNFTCGNSAAKDNYFTYEVCETPGGVSAYDCGV